MKIGLLHISDLHIEKDGLIDRTQLLSKAINYEVNEISNLYVVFSGDIVKHGRKEEYIKAKDFIDKLKNSIKLSKRGLINIEIIIVPGNHDCCFDDVNDTRKLIIDACKKDIIEKEDYYKGAMAVQDNFWGFYNDVGQNKISKEVSYKLEFIPHLKFKLVFHCYNTSWLTQVQEKQGDLIIPQNKFLENENGEYIVSLFHHPLEWLSANTSNNNKQRFEEHLMKTSNFVIYGHEHDKGKVKGIIQENNNVIFCGGKAFDKDNISETGFAFYEIDLSDKSVKTKIFKFLSDKYIIEDEQPFKFVEKQKREFIITDYFEKHLTQLKIPLKHSNKSKIILNDIFVYPDLEPLIEENKAVQYPNSSELIESVKNNKSIKAFIEGDAQSGKTSLLFTMYRRFYEMGCSPIFLRGKYSNDTNIRKLVKKQLKEQYGKDNVNLFFQQDKKIVFLDNLHKSKLNTLHKRKLIENLSVHFDCIFITSDSSLSSNSFTEEATTLKEYDKYKLLPLGHEKRNELIGQWLRIGKNQMTIDEDVLFSNIKSRFNDINTLMGNKLMPSYPIFILTLMQGIDENLQNYSQTSYADLYLVLIKSGLIKEKIKESVLTFYLNILKELAFYMFANEKESFTDDIVKDFFLKYEKEYFRKENHSDGKILATLINANILKFDDEYYTFSYKYIYFFLVAQKISDDIKKNESLISKLCNDIHLERNANILIFLSHHSKAQVLIDNIVFTSEVPFEDAKPITLNRDDEFVKFISEFTNTITDNIIEERNPKEEVKKELKTKDKIDREKIKDESNSDEYMTSEAIEMNQAFRITKIIGQIVKNQSGNFEKEKLVELVVSSYNTIFRFLGHFSEMLLKEKDELIAYITDDIKENKKNRDIKEIEKIVRKFLQFISWRVCVDSFSNLMFAVGSEGQNELYDLVSKDIDTTASKVVSFAIKTYYSKIDVKELQQLFNDTEHNYLAQCILREYVRKHLYTNIVERTKKEKIIRIAGFSPQSMIKKVQKN